MKDVVRVESLKLLDGFRVRILFTDGRERIVDLDALLEGPMFQSIRKDPSKFRQIRVDPDFGGLEWPNGADICPDLLYRDAPPAPLKPVKSKRLVSHKR